MRFVQFFIIIIFTLIKSNGDNSRSSNIQLIPSRVVLNSTSTADLFCINHESNDLPLMISLSKDIPEDQLKISRYQLNETTMQIRIQSINYLGIFRLFCYIKDKIEQGTLSDVIVKSEPGTVQLINQCQVYEKQYLKCIFRAPIIARAIQNDFPENFEFRENTNQQVYNARHLFLKNESTTEYLVFKWTPIVPGKFPDGITMNMTIKIPYFDPLPYTFDMTPILVIKPNFNLKKLSKNRIQIQLTPVDPPATCEKSITPKINSNNTQTWTMIKSTQNTTIIDNLLYDTSYEICIRCQQTSNDPYSTKQCQEMRTSNKIYAIIDEYRIEFIVIVSCLVLILIGVLIYRIYRKKQAGRGAQTVPDNSSANNIINNNGQLEYLPLNTTDITTDTESQTAGTYERVFNNNSRVFD